MNAFATSPYIVIMGVCGAGKSAVGTALSEKLNCGFVEADDFHSPLSRSKMMNGVALTDADRMPWLEAVAERAITLRQDDIGPVIACSALKPSYRKVLSDRLSGVFFVHLKAERSILEERLQTRKSHFVGVALLESQLAALEPLVSGENGITLDCSQPLTTILDQVVTRLEAVNESSLKANTSQQFTAEN